MRHDAFIVTPCRASRSLRYLVIPEAILPASHNTPHWLSARRARRTPHPTMLASGCTNRQSYNPHLGMRKLPRQTNRVPHTHCIPREKLAIILTISRGTQPHETPLTDLLSGRFPFLSEQARNRSARSGNGRQRLVSRRP